MHKKVKYLILGAGPCGLGAGYRLKDLGEDDFLLLEKSERVGGLATSYKDEKGFIWDIGGHVQFSHYDYFDRVMEKALGQEGWYHHEREAWVWIKENFVPYPFQNNIHRLPEESCQDCLKSLIERDENRKINNFRDWLEKSFGKELCELFMFPYNFKVWAYPPEALNKEWVGERVAKIDLARIKENIKLNRDDVSWGPNNTFQFPKVGGTGAIWNSVGQSVGMEKVRLNTSIMSIDAKQKKVLLKSGEIEYEHILNTTPLTTLTKLVGNEQLIELASNLKSSSSHIIGIGFEGKLPQKLENKCWMYFPENNSPYYRITVFSNYSPANVPEPGKQFSLMAEVSESPLKRVDEENIVEQVLTAMREDGLIGDEKVVSKWYFKAPLGYPTPSLERDQILKQLMSALSSISIDSRGRFGAWKYEISNQDHTFMQGVEWVDKKISGKDEETFKLT